MPAAAKLNPTGRSAFRPGIETGDDVTEETERLMERWILAFCEPPPLLDAELMARLLAEHEAKETAR